MRITHTTVHIKKIIIYEKLNVSMFENKYKYIYNI